MKSAERSQETPQPIQRTITQIHWKRHTSELSDGKPTASAAADRTEHLATDAKDPATKEAGEAQTAKQLRSRTRTQRC